MHISDLSKLKDPNQLQGMSFDDLRYCLLCYLEQKVGSKDPHWTIKKTQFWDEADTKSDTERPMTFFPKCPNNDVIQILLTRSTENDSQQRLFQMSHEVVHLLDPVPREEVNHLEEGFASWFSVHVCEDIIPKYKSRESVLDPRYKYGEPFELIDKIENPLEILKKIRSNGYTMANVEEKFLRECTNQIYLSEEIDSLLKKFY